MTLSPSRSDRRQLARDNLAYPEALVRVPEEKLNRSTSVVPRHRQPTEVWRSRGYLVQVFPAADGAERLSCSVSEYDPASKRFRDGLSWDDLQRLKRECGRGARDAVEIYPADKDIVNVANMRHIFVLPRPFYLTWRVSESTSPSEIEKAGAG